MMRLRRQTSRRAEVDVQVSLRAVAEHAIAAVMERELRASHRDVDIRGVARCRGDRDVRARWSRGARQRARPRAHVPRAELRQRHTHQLLPRAVQARERRTFGVADSECRKGARAVRGSITVRIQLSATGLDAQHGQHDAVGARGEACDVPIVRAGR
jgi:hypothetical protein